MLDERIRLFRKNIAIINRIYIVIKNKNINAMENTKVLSKKKLEELLNRYEYQAKENLQKPRWKKVYIGVSIVAFILLITLNHYDLNDTGWFFGYVGCWLMLFLAFALFYFFLPKKWKWIGKSFTKSQLCDQIMKLLESDIQYSKKRQKVLEKEQKDNENILAEREKLLEVVKNLEVWLEVFLFIF